MTLQQLKYAVAVAESNSLTEASGKLFISQPSLSAAIHELEEQLEISIFRRTNRGITVTQEGEEFLRYARGVVQQEQLLEEKYLGAEKKIKFGVSCQHYAFAVSAFVSLVSKYGMEKYDFALRETKTHEIIEDVRSLKSNLGILYLNDFNRKVITRELKEADLDFTSLFKADAHVFLSRKNPLAGKASVTLEDLAPYPCLSYEQGDYASFFYAEELLSDIPRERQIWVTDRATLSNLLIGINGYTICSGVINNDLNGSQITSVKLTSDADMEVGYITGHGIPLTELSKEYIGYIHESLQ